MTNKVDTAATDSIGDAMPRPEVVSDALAKGAVFVSAREQALARIAKRPAPEAKKLGGEA